ncbi:MAG: outer membrane beta-barrel protein [Spirochaetaceae bacterium]|jgi:TolB-like protein|nr:outer membrane beta-barrel protein [Spirochaetaceae bacterium]
MKIKHFLFCLFCFGFSALGLPAQPVDIDTALRKSADYIEQILPSGAIVVVLNVDAQSAALAEYITDELSSSLINGRSLTVVDRENLSAIQQEIEFQMSGEVSDESAQSIGKKTGAQTIILGSLQPLGSEYRLTFRALSVETAAVQGMQRHEIKFDKRLSALLRGDFVRPVSELWKYKWLYFGLRGGGGINMKYRGSSTEPIFDFGSMESSFGLNGAFSINGQITEWLGIQTEFMYTHDKIKIHTADGSVVETAEGGLISSGGGDGEFTFHSFMIPILAKLTFRPGKFSLSALGGVYFGIPLGELSFNGTLQAGDWAGTFKPQNTNIGLMFGGNIGYHLGPGVLFIDLRYALDVNRMKFEPVAGSWGMWNDYTTGWRFMPDLEFSRNKILFSIGYEIGVLNK